jgi:hypothetical protein
MAVASVRKPKFTSREDSAQDFAMKTRDLASGLGAGTLRNGLEPSLQIGLIGFNADSGDPSEVHSAEGHAPQRCSLFPQKADNVASSSQPPLAHKALKLC